MFCPVLGSCFLLEKKNLVVFQVNVCDIRGVFLGPLIVAHLMENVVLGDHLFFLVLS